MYDPQEAKKSIQYLIEYFGFKTLTPEKLQDAIKRDLEAGSDENIRTLFVSEETADLFSEESVSTAKTIVQREYRNESWSLNEYVRGMLYAMLSNQRGWEPIKKKKDEIEELFHYFKNLEWIKDQCPDYFIAKIKKLKCGNMHIKSQMAALKHNIKVLEKIAAEHGSVDSYIAESIKNHQEIALIKSFADTNGAYKLQELGPALVCEFLKYFGVNICKPDAHVLRFVGAERMGWIDRKLSQDKEKDVYDAIRLFSDLSKDTGYSAPFLDTLVWNFCHDDGGKLGICGANPKCEGCTMPDCCKRSRE